MNNYKVKRPNKICDRSNLNETAVLESEESHFSFFFIQNTCKSFSGNYRSVLQTNVWKNENLNCDFPSKATYLKFNQYKFFFLIS